VTREEQITAALELLAPQPPDRDEGLHDVGRSLDRVETGAAAARSFKVVGSKEGRRKLESYLAALQRVKIAYGALDPAIRPWFSLPQANIDREIVTATEFLARPSRRSGASDASRNKAAVKAARDLLGWWNHKVTCTRGGEWAQMAAILAGNENLDLFDHMCTLKHSPAPILMKIRDAEGSIVKIACRPTRDAKGAILKTARRRKPGIK
jgi:hypothetical protein